MPERLFRATAFVWVVLGVFVLLMATIVVGALRRPEVAELAVTPPAPIAVGDSLIGPATVTVDATSDAAWTFFDFSRNAVVPDPGPRDWDLAFRRFHIIANGGPGFAGRGGIADLGEVPLDAVPEAPADGYHATTRDSANPGLGKWYRYGYTSHVLEPHRRTWAVRTADGKYALFEIVSYYCPGARSGCFTLRYAYRGDGGRSFGPGAGLPAAAP
jgi:hypothetical protein